MQQASVVFENAEPSRLHEQAEAAMRAFAVQRFGEAPGIHDLPIPDQSGTFLIRVTNAGVNPIDYKLVEELTETSTYPFVVGIDFAGVLESIPNEESELRVGDRVFGIARSHGAYAEYTAVAPGEKTQPLARIPDGVTSEQAAALPIPALTALRSLQLMDVAANQTLVVMGATGGVGGYATQMSLARGAHVIATVRGDTAEAHRLGAEEVFDTTAGDVIDQVRDSHPDGVDAVLDLVNRSDAIGRDAEIVRAGGSLVSTLYAADEAWFAKRDIKAINISSLKNPLSSSQGLTEVGGMVADGTVTVRVSRTASLDGAGELLRRLRKGEVRGKAVIRL